MNVTARYDTALSLFQKRKVLLQEIEEMKKYQEYLKHPIMTRKEYLNMRPSGGRTTFGILAGVSLAVSLFLFFRMLFIQKWDGILTMILFIILFFVFFMILEVKKGSHYDSYLSEEKKNRANYEAKLKGYDKKTEELRIVENNLSDAEICDIPRKYWDKGEELINNVKCGIAKDMEEAIQKL